MMAATDPIEAVTTDERREFTRLRSLLVTPGGVYLARQGGKTWLTDEITLIDVSDSPAVAGVPDGYYRLVMGKGFVQKGEVPGVPSIDLDSYFDRVRGFEMYPAHVTPWCIKDSAAKAMLCYVSIDGWCLPLAMNEDLWHSLALSYPGAELWHAGHGGPFKVTATGWPELAYVEPVRIPDELQAQAVALVDRIEQEIDS